MVRMYYITISARIYIEKIISNALPKTQTKTDENHKCHIPAIF